MKNRKCRLSGYLLAAAMLAGIMVPFHVEAAGQMKCVQEKWTYYNADGSVNYTQDHLEEYDENENLLKSVWYKADGTEGNAVEHEYDRNGNCIKTITYNGGAVTDSVEREYDEKGNLLKVTERNADGSVKYITESEYDGNGDNIRNTRYEADGSVSSDIAYKYEYDGNGNQIRRTVCNAADGSVASVSEYEYDGNGNQIKSTQYRADGSTGSVTEYEYDAEGILRKQTSHTPGGHAEVGVQEFDRNGNQVKYIMYGQGGSIIQAYDFEYNENGDLTKRTVYDRDGAVTSYNTVAYETKYMPVLPEGNKFASHEGFDFYKDEHGITCYDSNGVQVINEFKCDGTYTYFFQDDGTAMRDRLSYHPDGVHVIYFDKDGHEVFSDFANVKMAIAGNPVDDFCFFDVYGYLYVDVVTYDKTGTVLYYANPYGVMERGKWFQFSDKVKCADGTTWEGAAGNYGYANADGTLMTNQWTYDWENRYCYMQGNGVALYP